MARRNKKRAGLPELLPQETARALMKQYQAAIGRKGATQIVREIKTQTGGSIELKTLYNWMRGISQGLTDRYFGYVCEFIATPFFQNRLKILQSGPATRKARSAYQERNRRLAFALFDIYGRPDSDLEQLDKHHAAIEGLWKSRAGGPVEKPCFFFATRPKDCPFSFFLAVVPEETKPFTAIGAAGGLLFFDYGVTFNARGWSIMSPFRAPYEDVAFWLTYGPKTVCIEFWPDRVLAVRDPEPRLCLDFEPADVSELDDKTIKMFDVIKRNVIPRGIGSHNFY